MPDFEARITKDDEVKGMARFCPIFFATKSRDALRGGASTIASFECLEKACAWYDKRVGSCAVLLLAMSLGKLAAIDEADSPEPDEPSGKRRTLFP